jgi:hypothetical protein
MPDFEINLNPPNTVGFVDLALMDKVQDYLVETDRWPGATPPPASYSVEWTRTDGWNYTYECPLDGAAATLLEMARDYEHDTYNRDLEDVDIQMSSILMTPDNDYMGGVTPWHVDSVKKTKARRMIVSSVTPTETLYVPGNKSERIRRKVGAHLIESIKSGLYLSKRAVEKELRSGRLDVHRPQNNQMIDMPENTPHRAVPNMTNENYRRTRIILYTNAKSNLQYSPS